MLREKIGKALILCTVVMLTGCGQNEERASSEDLKVITQKPTEIIITTEPTITEEPTEVTVSEEDDTEVNDKQTKYYEVGDTVKLGIYGGESIEWVVLACDEEKALLWSEYCIDAQKYNNALLEEVTWETCSLRKWLNTDFLSEAFNSAEQRHIIKQKLENVDCGDTEDRVFVLSAKELVQYFPNDIERVALPTEYAVTQGIFVNSGSFEGALSGKTYYWIRGNHSKRESSDADFISSRGEIKYNQDTNDATMGVRPAVWYCYQEKASEPESDETSVGKSDDILCESAERYLTQEDLKGLTGEQLRLARNEIYARHGYQFESEDLKSYFESKDWYYAKYPREKFLECFLNIYEKYNVQMILAAERGEEYTGDFTLGYGYEEISDDVKESFSGDLELSFFNDLCGQWDNAKRIITITPEKFDGFPYRLLKFQYSKMNMRYQIALEVYYNHAIEIVNLVTDGQYIADGFNISYYDKDGMELTEDGYKVESERFWKHYEEETDAGLTEEYVYQQDSSQKEADNSIPDYDESSLYDVASTAVESYLKDIYNVPTVGQLGACTEKNISYCGQGLEGGFNCEIFCITMSYEGTYVDGKWFDGSYTIIIHYTGPLLFHADSVNGMKL